MAVSPDHSACGSGISIAFILFQLPSPWHAITVRYVNVAQSAPGKSGGRFIKRSIFPGQIVEKAHVPIMSDVQNQKRGDDQRGDAAKKPVVNAVVFSAPASEIRKKDFLQFAFFRNEEMISCYQNAMQRLRGRGQKKLLGNMLERKNGIKDKFLREIDATGIFFTGKTNSITSSAVKYILDTDLRPVNTMVEVFTFVMKKERKELELFLKLADLEENQDVKEIFLEQASICKDHIRNLENDFASLTSQASHDDDVDIDAF
jgi:rubrerythrin